jgi:membrane-bound serine protease (ClpP class)
MDYLTIAIILFVIGAILLAAEVLLPTGGIFVVVSLLFFALGVGIIFAQGTNMEALAALGGLVVGFPVAGLIAVSAWRRLSIGAILPSDDVEGYSASRGLAELESLANHTGKTVSPMRPSGTVEFDGRRIDAMTEGVMIEEGVWVRCIAVKGGKVIVRQIESPADIASIASGEPLDEYEQKNSNVVIGPTDIKAPPQPREKPKVFDDLDDLDIGLDK